MDVTFEFPELGGIITYGFREVPLLNQELLTLIPHKSHGRSQRICQVGLVLIWGWR